MSAILLHRQARPHLELKTWPRVGPVSLSMSTDFEVSKVVKTGTNRAAVARGFAGYFAEKNRQCKCTLRKEM